MFDSPAVLDAVDSAAPLEQVALRWTVLVGRDTRPVGFRLALTAQAPAADLAATLEAVVAGFTAEGSAGPPQGMVLLAPQAFELAETLLRWRPPRNVLLEVPHRALADRATTPLLYEVQRHGVRLALRVEPGQPLPQGRAPLFQYLIDAAGGVRGEADAALIATGVTSRAQADAAFKRGASAILGWPQEAVEAPLGLQPQQCAVLELIRMVQADADLRDLERAFKAEPLLAYLLLTLANSPAFVRTRPVGSLAQAIGMLGYKRLVKWLVLLLVIASKTSNALPSIYAAVARGFTMEGLATAAGLPLASRDECFVAGVFSLLDRITGQPLSSLVKDNGLPPVLTEALLGGAGEYARYLALAATLDGYPLASAAAPAVLSQEAINRALLQALASNDALQSVV